MTQPYLPQPMAYAGPMTPVYYASERRGRVMRALLWAMMALDFLGIGITLYQFRLPPDAFENDAVEIPIGFLIAMLLWIAAYLGALVATIVLVCMWMYRAHANLTLLGTTNLDYTSGWAAGAWFVPFLNLVRPFRIMKEIHKGSAPWARPNDLGWKFAPDPPIIGWWWAAWLISNIASNISMRMEFRGDADIQRYALYIDLVVAPISMAAAWLLIRISRTIDEMQAVRWSALSQYDGASQYSQAAPYSRPPAPS